MKIKTNKGTLAVELVSENEKTVWVRLPDGNVIKRNKSKIVKWK